MEVNGVFAMRTQLAQAIKINKFFVCVSNGMGPETYSTQVI